jgi:NTE family protein
VDKKRRDTLAACLTQVFGSVDDTFVDSVVPLLDWMELAGGETLFRQGDAEDGVYFVISGRLRASMAQNGHVRMLNEVGRGETVGEMAVITGEPRSATVTALRDTVLAHADRASFHRLCLSQPELSLNMAKLTIERLKRTTTREKINRPATICLLAITDGIDVQAFADALGSALDRWGVAAVESSRHIDELFGSGVAQATPAEGEHYEKLTLWLDDLEFWNEFVLFVTDDRDTEWTRRCLRQADEVLLLARADATPQLHDLESTFCSGEEAITSARQTLVLLHDAGTSHPRGTPAWLDRRPIDNVVHVRRDSERDVSRLARIVSGNAVGLVLAGGGARGFAHLGVYKALEELGIEVDLIAGTSMGAAMGAAISLDLRADELIEITRRTFRKSPISDYNLLPMISLFRGRKLRDAIATYIRDTIGEDADISDSWRTVCCVATNYTQASEKILARGSLSRAILASASIPVALPPVPWEGDLLVDGCVFNNFPATVMMGMNARRIIGVDLSSRKPRPYEHAEIPGPLELLRDGFRGRRRRYRLPSLGTVMMTSNLLYSESRREQARSQVDVYINPELSGVAVLDWKAFDRVTKAGYESAKQVLSAMSEEELARYKGDGSI